MGSLILSRSESQANLPFRQQLGRSHDEVLRRLPGVILSEVGMCYGSQVWMNYKKQLVT